MYIKNIKYLLVLFLFSPFVIMEASYTVGSIDPIYRSALLCTNDTCSTTSKINFKPTLGNPVVISDSAVTGNIWSETFGWVNLNPNYGGVTNTPLGILGGYAWGDGAGWINFAPTQGGVTINNSGQFSGFAWSENYGWIKFNCSISDACVSTDWRPLSSRPSESSGSMPSTTHTIVPAIVAPTTLDPSFPVSIKIVKKPTVKIYNPVEDTIPIDNNFTNPQPEEAPAVNTSDIIPPHKLTPSLSRIDQEETKNKISFLEKTNNIIIQSLGFVEGNIFSNHFMGISLSYRFLGYQGYINPLWLMLFILIAIFIIIFWYKKKKKDTTSNLNI